MISLSFRSGALRPLARLPRPSARLTPLISTSNLATRPLSVSHTLAKGGSKNKKSSQPADTPEESPVKAGHKHGKASVSTSTLIPASQSKLSPEAQTEADKVDKKMAGNVEWFRKEAVALENRALGRVTPAILDPVKVNLGEDGGEVKLRDVATIGVKEGTVLVITLFDEHNMKAVEKGIYQAQILHCVPQKIDARTIRIPMPKPTLDARSTHLKSGSKLAEDAKVKIRRAGSDGIKWLSNNDYDKHTPEMKNMQTLTDKHTGEIDKVLQRLKKELEI